MSWLGFARKEEKSKKRGWQEEEEESSRCCLWKCMQLIYAEHMARGTVSFCRNGCSCCQYSPSKNVPAFFQPVVNLLSSGKWAPPPFPSCFVCHTHFETERVDFQRTVFLFCFLLVVSEDEQGSVRHDEPWRKLNPTGEFMSPPLWP